MKNIILSALVCSISLLASDKRSPFSGSVSTKDRLHTCVTYSALLGSIELMRRVAITQVMINGTLTYKRDEKRITNYAGAVSLLLHRCNKNELTALLLDKNPQSTIVSVEGIPVVTVPDVVEISYDLFHNNLRKYQEKWEKKEKQLPISSVLLKAYIKSKLYAVASTIAPSLYHRLPQSVTHNEWITNNKDLFLSYGPLVAHLLTDAMVEGIWKFSGLFGGVCSYKRSAVIN